jgi:hypothetical protein
MHDLQHSNFMDSRLASVTIKTSSMYLFTFCVLTAVPSAIPCYLHTAFCVSCASASGYIASISLCHYTRIGTVHFLPRLVTDRNYPSPFVPTSLFEFVASNHHFSSFSYSKITIILTHLTYLLFSRGTSINPMTLHLNLRSQMLCTYRQTK